MRGFLLAATACVLVSAMAAQPASAQWCGCDDWYTPVCCDGCCTVVVTTYTMGARISTVFYENDPPKDRPAANNSPLLVGDVILEADGQKVASSDQLSGVLGNAAGKTLKLVVVDPKKGLPFLVTLDLTLPKLKYGLKFDVVPVSGSVSEYYLSRP